MATHGCFPNCRFATIRLSRDSAVLNPCRKRLRDSLIKSKTMNSRNCTPANQSYVMMTVCSDTHRPVTFDVTWCCFSCRTSIFVFYVKTACDIVTILLIFAKYLSLYLYIFTCTYRGTHTQAHMYNQHTRGMATTRHRSLVERGERKALLETLHTFKTTKNRKKNVRKKPIFTNLKERFEHIELPAKLLDDFLRNNKSNINQPCVLHPNTSQTSHFCQTNDYILCR